MTSRENSTIEAKIRRTGTSAASVSNALTPPSMEHETRICVEMIVLYRAISKLLTQITESSFLRDSDLSLSQFLCLLIVESHAEISAGDIARLLDFNSGAVTRLLDQIETRGLITRQRQQVDRRIVLITITALGTETLKRLLPYLSELRARIISDLGKAEYVQLNELNQKVVSSLASACDAQKKLA